MVLLQNNNMSTALKKGLFCVFNWQRLISLEGPHCPRCPCCPCCKIMSLQNIVGILFHISHSLNQSALTDPWWKLLFLCLQADSSCCWRQYVIGLSALLWEYRELISSNWAQWSSCPVQKRSEEVSIVKVCGYCDLKTILGHLHFKVAIPYVHNFKP